MEAARTLDTLCTGSRAPPWTIGTIPTSLLPIARHRSCAALGITLLEMHRHDVAASSGTVSPGAAGSAVDALITSCVYAASETDPDAAEAHANAQFEVQAIFATLKVPETRVFKVAQ